MVSEELLKKLSEIGFSAEDIKKKKDLYLQEALKSFDKEMAEKVADRRIVTWSRTAMNDTAKKGACVLVGVGQLRDNNQIQYTYSTKNEGVVRPEFGNVKRKYTTQAGRYSWGMNQGKEIPVDTDGNITPDRELALLVAIKDGVKYDLKTLKMQNHKDTLELQKSLKVGDILDIMYKPTKNETLLILSNKSKVVVTGNAGEEKTTKLISGNLKSYITTVSALGKYKDKGKICIIAGDTSELNVYPKTGGGRFCIADPESEDMGELSYVNCSSSLINFTEDAIDVIVVGVVSFNEKNDKKSLDMEVFGTIVPEGFKRAITDVEVDSPEEEDEDEVEEVAEVKAEEPKKAAPKKAVAKKVEEKKEVKEDPVEEDADLDDIL